MTPAHISLSSTTLADLHERYRALKGARPTPAVADDIGVTTSTLLRYERDGIAGIRTLEHVAKWVTTQEHELRHNLKERLNTQWGY